MDLLKRIDWTIVVSWLFIALIVSIMLVAIHELYLYYHPIILTFINSKNFSLNLMLFGFAMAIIFGCWFAFNEGFHKKKLQ